MRFRRFAIGLALLFVLTVAAHAWITTDSAGASCQLTPSQMARVRGADMCAGCEIVTYTDCNQPSDPCVDCIDSPDYNSVNQWHCPSSLPRKYAGVNRNDCKPLPPANNKWCYRVPDDMIHCYTQYTCSERYTPTYNKVCDTAKTCNKIASGSWCKDCTLTYGSDYEAQDNALCLNCVP